MPIKKEKLNAIKGYSKSQESGGANDAAASSGTSTGAKIKRSKLAQIYAAPSTPVRTAGGGSTRNAAKEARQEQFAQKREQAAREREISDYVATLDQEQQDAYDRAAAILQGEKSSSDAGLPEGYRKAGLKDLTWNSLKQGYYNAVYGQESFKDMYGDENEKARYEELLQGEDYRFVPQGGIQEAVSGAANLLGQQVRQWTDPNSVLLATGAATAASLAGKAGPQIMIPEEIITVPAAFAAGIKLGSSRSNFEIEAGNAYNELIENGVSADTAKKIATGVGGVNAALEFVQLDELFKSFKILKKSGAAKNLTEEIGQELLRRGIDVASETAQEVAQEGATIAGAQLGQKLESGNWQYTGDEVKDRLLDTARSSALSFAAMNVPGAVNNTLYQVKNHGNSQTSQQDTVINNSQERQEQPREAVRAPQESTERQGDTTAEAQNNAQDGDQALLEAALSMAQERQEAAGGQNQQESQADREITNSMERVRRAAGALGESGGKALTAAYTEDTAKTIGPKEAVEGFYRVYNAAMKGEQLNGEEAQAAQKLPAHLRFAAESAGKQDALRAKQAQFFGEKAGLVKDDSWKQAHLSSKTTRSLDALGKALGVQIKFAETVAEGTANGQYADGTITLALDGENPVMTTVTHEAVHRLREASPEAYSALADFVRGNLSEETTDYALLKREVLNQSGDVDAMTEEMVADAFGRVLNDGKAIEQLVQDNRSLAEKVRDVLADIVNAVKRVLNHQNLELTVEQKAEFRELESQMGQMEQLFSDALGKAALQTGTGNGTMSADENFFWEGNRNGRKGAPGAGTAENLQGEERNRQQKTGGGNQRVRGELSDAAGRHGGVNPTFGAKPVRTWAEGHTVEPAKGSVAYTEQQTAMEYGVPSFVVADKVWTKNKGNTPAFSADGQIYLRENMPERNRGMYVPHEVTHVMKQVGYQPYLDFVERTPTMLNMSDPATMLLLNHVAEHLHTTIEDADPTRLYDEFNATMYGHIAGGKTGMFTNGPADHVFHDFNGYVKELTGLHERFKADNQKETKFSLKAPVEETDKLLALHNKDENSILAALKLGGLPMPSIAIVKARDGHTKYGPISLVFSKDTIDPKLFRTNKVYGGDAWTPTAPRVDYPVNSKKAAQLEHELHRLAGDTSVAGGIFGNSAALRFMGIDDTSTRSTAELAEKLASTDTVRAAYLADQGKSLEAVKKDKVWDRFGNDTLQKVIDRLGVDTLAETEANLETGESVKDALGENAEAIRDILRDYYREQGEPMLRRMAVKKHWTDAEINERRQTRIDNSMDGVSIFTLEGIVHHAWDMYQDGGATKGEIDRMATSDALRSAVDDHAVEEWISGKLDGLLGEGGIYNGKDPYTPSGNLRSFSQLHYAYTLENIVKAMKEGQEERGGNTWGVSAKTLQSVATPEYRSIQEIKADSGRLGMDEGAEYEAKLQAIDDQIGNIITKIKQGNKAHSDNSFIESDIIGGILVDTAKGKKTVDAIVRAFSKEGYKISSQTAQDIQAAYKAAAGMPTGYFEAKPQRAVGFDEVLAAVIPDDSSKKLRDGLEQAGVRMLEYKTGDNADRLAKINSVDNASFSRKEKDMLEAFRKEYGTIPKGEKPSREILLPRKTAADKKVSQTVRTILEAGATPEGMVPTVEDMVVKGDFSYDAYSDKKAISDAESQIQKVGWAQALTDWTSAVKSGEVSKANTAMGWALYNNAANSGDTKTALTVLNQMVEHQRSAAQALQATRILKSMSPETQLYGVQRSVENLQEELNKRYGDKKGPELKIDEDLAERFMRAKDQESRDQLLKEIYRDIGRQMPSRFVDRWNAWRYLAMLGNTRTHVRNIMGNMGFMPVVATKNLVGTAIESAVYRVSGKKLGRSKALVKGTVLTNVLDLDKPIILGGRQDRALLKAAWGDYAKVQEAALGGGKYSDFANANQYVEEGRKIFGNTKIGLWNATGGKALETFRKANSAALDVEDVWFSKPHYAYALSQYCKAHSITAEQIAEGKGLKAAREYAVLEAQKATYRDTNAFSQTISDLGRGSKAGKNKAKKAVATIMEGILPFRKTPANILARGVEYSPIGLVNGIKEAVWDVQKGTKTGAEAIDAISAGLSGTGLLALGIFMASQGLVRGHGGDDDKKKKFEEMQGHQAYALELPNGTSVTLDWLAPEALPYFIGVNLWEETGGERATLSDWMTSVTLVTEPLLEMSCLQSLNDVFDAVGYASSNEMAPLPSALSSAATSYLTQALPTALGQAERTGEDKRYTTYTEKNAFLTSDIQYTLGKASARIPGWDYQQIPYIDAWGRTEASGGTGTRAFNNFVNPAYTSQIQTSEMEKELLRLYEATGAGSVFPQRAEKYFTVDQERKDLTAEEYVKYATLKGQSAYQLVTDLVKDKKYQAMSDQDKVAAVENAYKLANQQAKQKVGGYEPESWIIKAAEAEKKYGVDQETYVLLKTQTAGIESLKDKDGESITNSKGLQIMETIYGYSQLTDKQKQAMFEYLGVGKTIRHYNPAKVKEELAKMKKR
nr:MAG TPA: nuclease [Caudoviricetes sp.]